MPGFANRLGQYGSAVAVVGAEGLRLTYRELSARVEAMCERLESGGRLLVIEAEIELECLIAYLAGLRSGNPVMLIPPGRDDLLDSIRSNYQPEWIYAKGDAGWRLEWVGNGNESPAPHPELGLLLSTSGSTGATKFVRLSHANLEANARSIVEYLGILSSDCAATTLPFHYCYGLSVINSYLMAGATLMLTDASVVDSEFWEACAEHEVTSFAGVPYTFELLDRIDFENKGLENLRYITQAGGRLPAAQVTRYREMGEGKGWQLFVMYGQTEATARMAYVPPDLLASNAGTIGIAIPDGEFRLVDEHGDAIEGHDRPGELLYRGPNVMMGYAETRADLVGGPELEELETGDIAQRDAHGLYSIVGRSKRFIKIFGLRVGLDEVERKLTSEGIRAVATGEDESLFIATLDAGRRDDIRRKVAAFCKIPPAVVTVREFDDYPLLPSGKVDYTTLISTIRTATRAAEATAAEAGSIRSILEEGTDAEDILPTDTFVRLGGDSMSYIRVSVALEALLGYVPNGWERLSVAELEALEPRTSLWTQIETSILLRAIAIVFIICKHFGVFDSEAFERFGIRYPGGSAMLLFVIAGFNFGRFQLPRAVEEGAKPILRSIWRVFLPSILFLATIQLVSGKFVWSTILMYSNFIGPNVNFGIEPWFIYVLLQILCILAILFSIPSFRSMAARSPYAVSLALLAMTSLTSLVGPYFWNTAPLFNRTPHMVMYAFMIGCCICLGNTPRQKLLHSALLAAYLVIDTSHYTWLVLGGGLILIWTQHLWLVAPLNRIAGALGAASLFIYLSHYNFQQYAQRLLGTESMLADVTAGLLGGVVLWFAWEKGVSIAVSILRSWRPTGSPSD